MKFADHNERSPRKREEGRYSENCAEASALRLPTFQADGARCYQRLTLILPGTRTEHVFFPVFPPNEHATRVLEWLEQHPLP